MRWYLVKPTTAAPPVYVSFAAGQELKLGAFLFGANNGMDGAGVPPARSTHDPTYVGQIS